MRISDWSSDVCSSDLDDDAVVVHHDRRLGKAQSVGDQFKLGHILSLACPHLLCFAAIMPVRTLFATNFYEADIGTPDLRSEEHTSELQSLMRISYAVFCLKKKHIRMTSTHLMYTTYEPPNYQNQNQ